MRSRARKPKGDERQLDLLDWLDAQPSYAPKAPARSRPRLVAGTDVDEDQLDLVDLIASVTRAA
ncbi:hypothetical protein [Brevundimonas sp.]|uniref:hypothetical protein n=1 Tax=Brevundimonas sp. TaxID=1871086 RepID=UPI00289B5F9B|nr:hypothetical protein [Brevundimonas sp.]